MSIFEVLKPIKMTIPTTALKIESFVDTKLLPGLKELYGGLRKGDLLSFERGLSHQLVELYNMICEQVLSHCSAEIGCSLRREAYDKGCRKMEERPTEFRLQTGHFVRLSNYYIKQLPGQIQWKGSRHTLDRHWSIIGHSSPAHYDKVAFSSVLCPSYDIAKQTLNKFDVEQKVSSVRKLTNTLASRCRDQEVVLSTQASDTLAGKRVVIGLDGGRTRTRCYNDQVNKAGNPTFDTPWREPKLFTISLLDEKGNLEKEYPPIYGCRFDEAKVIDLLGQYLRHLNIDQAALVQIVADGAPWIWNRTQPLLIELGVDQHRIVETLDYCHATGYIHKLVEHLPKRVGKPARRQYIKQFKDWLWQGKSNQIVNECRKLYRRQSGEVKRWINYLDKHCSKTQYADYEKRNLMCGSGIIESGIRRIINLRFKNTGTFWKTEIVECLYFLRATLLSKRWDLLINNLVKQT